MTRQHAVLTAIWIASLLVALGIVEAYIALRTEEGYRVLLAEDRDECLKPILTLYASYIGGILAFWFTKPFRPPKSDRAAAVRLWIALVCTVVFNVAVLYLIGQKHLSLDLGLDTVADDVAFARTVGLWMSFLVAPVNLFYFGAKAPS